MPSKPRFAFTDKDDIVWQKLEEDTDEWIKSARKKETYLAVVELILKHRNGKPEQMHSLIKGGYNIVYRLEYKDGTSTVLRIPIKDVVPFPEEKIRYEVATMRYVAANTTIPIPHVHYYGTADENPTGLGPFIIMDYIEHHQNMSRELLDPKRAIHERPFLDPDISEEKLELIYAQMANILLQLSTLRFPRIGSLVEEAGESDKTISVKGRPLTANMIDIIVHTNAPASILPSQTYDTANEWHRALADMHMAQLAFQQNDAVEDKDDARDKPANVLLDKNLRVVGVIDWDFAYAAPAQFSFDPPWWLLLEEPEWWPGGYDPWLEAYEPRLRTFLRVIEAEEQKMTSTNPVRITGGTSLTGGRMLEKPLSQRMREGWEERTWMINYAARKSWAFDFVWWKFLDESYFGANENQDYQARLESLSEPQRKIMETFVTRKIEEGKTVEMIKWEDEDSAEYLAELLV